MRQVHLQIDDRLYVKAEARALELGFDSVDAYLDDVIADALDAESEAVEPVFTPERLRTIYAAAAEIRAGQFLTAEQTGRALIDAFQASPHPDVDLAPARSPMPVSPTA